MDEKKVLKDVADTLLDEPVKIEVDILHKTWLDKLLIKLNLKKPKSEFYIKRAPLAKMLQISRELLDIDLTQFDNNNLLESNYKLIAGHAERLAKVVAIATTTGKDNPSKRLVKFFLDNLTAAELFTVSSIVLKHLDINSFMLSIISIKGTNVLQTGASLKSKETIAFGKQSEE